MHQSLNHDARSKMISQRVTIGKGNVSNEKLDTNLVASSTCGAHRRLAMKHSGSYLRGRGSSPMMGARQARGGGG